MSDEQTPHGDNSIHIPNSTVAGHVLGGQGNTLNVHNYPKPEFPIRGMPHPNPNFTGRAEQLAQLHTALSQREAKVAITQAISGLGGVGKTQLALAYAHQYHAEYDLVWWLNGSSGPTLDSGLRALGGRLNLPLPPDDAETARQMVLSWLSSTAERWLLIYDNVDGGAEENEASTQLTPRTLRPYLPGGAGRVLVTSRNQQWANVATVLPLHEFTAEESATFWQKQLGTAAAEEETARAELAEELGRLPLALEHAAAYMREKHKAAADYLRLFREQRRALWQHTEPPNNYHATVATTWLVNFNEIKKTAGAAELLALCACLAPDDLPLDLLKEQADALVSTGLFNLVFWKNHPQKTLRRVLKDEVMRDEAVGVLHRYALVQSNGAGQWGMHRLVQAVYRDEMGEAVRREWVAAAVSWITKAYRFDQHDMATWPAAARLIPHLQAMAEGAKAWGVESKQTAWLNNAVAVYLNHYGQFQSAKPYYERALAIYERALGPDHPHTATSINNLGLLLQAMGELTAARPYTERALAIYERALGPDHPNTAASLNNLGYLLQAMGELTAARPYYERALDIRERALGPDHPNTAQSLNNLGSLLHDMGELDVAQPYTKRALDIRERALGPNHPDTAQSLNNLGLLLQAMGELAAARPYYKRALAICEYAFGPDHPDTANSLNNLGYLLQAMGELTAARPYYERALAIHERAFGPNHPNTAASLNNLGSLMQDMGELTAAQPYYERALAIHERALGSDHPLTAASVWWMAVLAGKKGDLQEAKAQYQRALAIFQKVLGEQHLYTKNVRRSLAAIEAKMAHS